jgi:hypothetical protein
VWCAYIIFTCLHSNAWTETIKWLVDIILFSSTLPIHARRSHANE